VAESFPKQLEEIFWQTFATVALLELVAAAQDGNSRPGCREFEI
jgi:hypothetical protein